MPFCRRISHHTCRLLFSLLLCSILFPAHATTNTEPQIQLRLQGSNTIGARLAPAWAKAFLETRGVSAVSIAPTATENEFLVSGSDAGGKRIGIRVAAHGSATGFQALASGEADIAMSSRPIKADERDALHALGDMEDAQAEHAVAIDGLAILVNAANPIDKLTREQIAALFAGEIHNWRELGGPDRAVTLYARDERSGTWETFRELVLGKTRQLSTSAQRFESSDQLSDAVSSDAGAIGFSGLASIRRARAVAVADGASQALRPTTLAVATEDYALSRRLFLYAPPKNPQPLVREFIEFCQSRAGQAVVADTHFVSQNIEMLSDVAAPNAPSGYRDLTQGAQRLSLNFRFKQGNSLLDNKALRDIDRLSQFLRQPENRDRRVYLIGFADNERNEQQSRVISRFRALAVRAALMQRSVPVFGIEGFGAFLPVAGNPAAGAPELAAAKNGRVEVWLAATNPALVLRAP